jgi:hypothetical protein
MRTRLFEYRALEDQEKMRQHEKREAEIARKEAEEKKAFDQAVLEADRARREGRRRAVGE